VLFNKGEQSRYFSDGSDVHFPEYLVPSSLNGPQPDF